MGTVADTLLFKGGFFEVHDVPVSNLFKVSGTWNGEDFELTARAYTKRVDSFLSGNVEIHVSDKRRKTDTVVPYPYHFLYGNMLFSFKRYRHEMRDAFALNLNLFDLEWEACMIVHFRSDGPMLYLTSRKNWEAKGAVAAENREPQVFLEVDEQEPIRLAMVEEALFVAPAIRSWLSKCRNID